MDESNKNSIESIDRLAQGFFISLVFCSLMSDSYITIHNFIKNDYIKKKINYLNKIYKVVVCLTFNNYKDDNEGNIIIEENSKNNIVDSDNESIECNNKSKNPFIDYDSDDEKEDHIEKIELIKEENEVYIEKTEPIKEKEEEIYIEKTEPIKEEEQEIYIEKTEPIKKKGMKKEKEKYSNNCEKTEPVEIKSIKEVENIKKIETIIENKIIDINPKYIKTIKRKSINNEKNNIKEIILKNPIKIKKTKN